MEKQRIKRLCTSEKTGYGCFFRMRTAAIAQTETSARTVPNPADFVGVVSTVVGAGVTEGTGTVVDVIGGIVVI
jgi:hypothetical protein